MEDPLLGENVHDKVDEELEEMEADGSEESDARSGSVPDPFSRRTFNKQEKKLLKPTKIENHRT